MSREAEAVVDELTYRNYVHNRMLAPKVPFERWALIFPNVPEMEERFSREFVNAVYSEEGAQA